MNYIVGIWITVFVVWQIKTDQSGEVAGYNWLLPASVLALIATVIIFFVKKRKASSENTQIDVADKEITKPHSGLKINKTKIQPDGTTIKPHAEQWELIQRQCFTGKTERMATVINEIRSEFSQQYGSITHFKSADTVRQKEYIHGLKRKANIYAFDRMPEEMAGITLFCLTLELFIEDSPSYSDAVELLNHISEPK